MYRASARRIVATLALTGSSPADAADLAADAFVRAWERWGRVGRMDRPDLWVLTVAMNLRRRGARRLRREVPRPPVDLPAGELAPVETDVALLAAVAGLPERQRAAIVLRYFTDLTEPQYAEVLGVRVGTVAASLTHARRALARTLGGPDARRPGARRPSGGGGLMSNTLDDRLRRALAASADAATAGEAEPDLPAAFGRRRRRHGATSRLAVAGLALAAVVAGAVVWQSSNSDEGTVTGPDATAGEGALPVTLPDGYTFTVTLPPAAGAPDPVVTTWAWVTLDGCCPDASVTFTPRPSSTPTTGSPGYESVGSWETSSGLRLTLKRFGWPPTAGPGGEVVDWSASAGASFEDLRAIVGRVGGYDMRIGTFMGGALDGVEAAEAATDDLAVEIAAHGYPVLAEGSRRTSYSGPTVTPGPGVMVALPTDADTFGPTASVDLGPAAPTVSISRSTCTDDSIATTTTTSSLPVVSVTRCFPDAGVRAYAGAPGADAARVEQLVREMQIEP